MKWHFYPQGRLSRFADTFYLRREKSSFAVPTPCKKCRSAVQTTFRETTNFPTLIFNKGIGVGIQIVFNCSSKCTPCKWSIKKISFSKKE